MLGGGREGESIWVGWARWAARTRVWMVKTEAWSLGALEKAMARTWVACKPLQVALDANTVA